MILRRFLVVTAILAASALPAHAQDPAASLPSFQAFGFADILYAASDRRIPDGFALGQVVGHLNGVLSNHLAFFGEMSATPRDNGFAVEVERMILRYDFNDLLKLSAGRFHSGISYWNTAFHHGLWLQTSIARPDLIRFGSTIVPVHFVGAMVEGTALPATLGLNYAAGIGNGRGDVISRAGDAGDTNASRAFTASAFVRPPAMRGLQIGAALYTDDVPRISDTGETDDISERIASAHFVLARGTPEIIAEYVRLWHAAPAGSYVGSNAGYVQAAWRLSESVGALKPYARWEHTDFSRDDPLFGDAGADYDAIIGGVRWDALAYAALKAEYRGEKFNGGPRLGTIVMQVSFALAGGSHGM
jgi:hypothetical protein